MRTGSVLAGYRFDSLIGEGAMGAVCLAEDATHELRVAVKAYKRPPPPSDPTASAWPLDEPRALGTTRRKAILSFINGHTASRWR